VRLQEFPGEWSDRLHVMGTSQQFVLRRVESPCLKHSTALFPQPFHRRWREHHERTASAADRHEPMGYSARNLHERTLSSRHDFTADVEAAGAFQYVERRDGCAADETHRLDSWTRTPSDALEYPSQSPSCGARSPLKTRRSPSPGATKSARKDSVITQRAPVIPEISRC
jgi:hypothetical protein